MTQPLGTQGFWITQPLRQLRSLALLVSLTNLTEWFGLLLIQRIFVEEVLYHISNKFFSDDEAMIFMEPFFLIYEQNVILRFSTFMNLGVKVKITSVFGTVNLLRGQFVIEIKSFKEITALI